MNKLFLTGLVLLLSHLGSVAQSSPDTLTTVYDQVVDKRKNTFSFYEKQLLISEPSLLSPFSSFNTSGKKIYILNADIRVPIGIGGSSFATGTRTKYWMSYFEVLPDIKIRIFQDDPTWGDTSLPVRTPSLRAGISYLGAMNSWWNTSRPDKHYIGFTAYHHSNGQDGTEIINDSVNLYNGNFGEQVVLNAFYGGVYQSTNEKETRLITSEDDIQDKNPKFNQARWSATHRDNFWLWRVGFEFHPWEEWGTNVVFKEHYLYGRHRIQLKGGLISSPTYTEYIHNGTTWVPNPDRTAVKKEKWRFIMNVEYITDLKYNSGLNVTQLTRQKLFDPTKRLNVDLTGYYRFPELANMALFARVSYFGSDNYNIYFQNSYSEIRLGLAFAFFIYPKT